MTPADQPTGPKLRVLATLHGATFGGPANELVTVMRGRASRLAITVALPAESGSAAPRLRDAGAAVLELSMTRLRRLRSPGYWLLFPLRFAWDVGRLVVLARRRADLVHGFGSNLQAAVAAVLARRPLVWSIVDAETPRLYRRLVSLVVRTAARSVLLDGPGMAKEYPGITNGRAVSYVYYPPVDLTRFAPSPRTTAERAVRVGTVANLNPSKDMATLVGAAEIVVEWCEAVFLITGARHATHASLAGWLEDRAAAFADGRLQFLGETDDVPSRLRGLDIFVVSSVREGTTTTAIEAMACGLPVVATAVGGVPDVVIDGETGLLVPPGDAEAMAAAILTLVGDASLRERFGAAGRLRAEALFSSTNYLDRIDAAYGSALQARSSGAGEGHRP